MVAVDGERQEGWVQSHQSGSFHLALLQSTLISYFMAGSAASCNLNGVLHAVITRGNLRNWSCPSNTEVGTKSPAHAKTKVQISDNVRPGGLPGQFA